MAAPDEPNPSAQGDAGSQGPPGPMNPLGPTDPREIAGYRLRARLGSGGMGSVYLSYSPGGQRVALKVVRAELADDPDFRRRFELEVQAARRVQGVYTIPVLDSSTAGSLLWLATAYVPAPSLADVVRAHGPLPVQTVLLLVAGVAEALQSIHSAGVVHRDLKPGNVLLAADGPKVIDFGIARAADATSLTGTDVRVGTPSYMAPEQITGISANPATDLFALGLVTHYAATGAHPFGEGAAHALMYRIVQDEPRLGAAPEPLRGLIAACLAKDPAARPSPEEVIEACRGLSPGHALQRPDSWLPPALAAEVTQRLRIKPPAAAPSPAVPGPPPAAPLPPFPPAAPAPAARRRTGLLLVATAVTAAILGGVLTAQALDDDDPATDRLAGLSSQGPDDGDDGNSDDRSQDQSRGAALPSPTGAEQTPGSGTEGGAYTLVSSEVELDIVAPIFLHDTHAWLDRCSGGNLIEVDLDALTVETDTALGQPPGEDTEFQYLYCDQPELIDQGIEFNHQGFAGLIGDPDASAEECYEAAHTPTLPHLIPIDDIRADETLREDMGICFETSEKNVVLLWFTQVTADPHNQDLRTYLATAIQWRPSD